MMGIKDHRASQRSPTTSPSKSSSLKELYRRLHGARWTFAHKTMGDRVDSGSGAEKQHDVHPQPTAGFSLTLHPKDALLALFGEEGDTLHTGGRSLWLTSVVLLRCHKRRTACAIILCTYLGTATLDEV